MGGDLNKLDCAYNIIRSLRALYSRERMEYTCTVYYSDAAKRGSTHGRRSSLCGFGYNTAIISMF